MDWPSVSNFEALAWLCAVVVIMVVVIVLIEPFL